MVSDKEIAEDWEKYCLGEISYLQKNIGEMNAIREDFPDDWEIEELTRAIIHDEGQIIEMLREEVENERTKLS
jgi:hypothetical protein